MLRDGADTVVTARQSIRPADISPHLATQQTVPFRADCIPLAHLAFLCSVEKKLLFPSRPIYSNCSSGNKAALAASPPARLCLSRQWRCVVKYQEVGGGGRACAVW